MVQCVTHRYLFTVDRPEYWENKYADQTLEVLMSDLDPAIMDQFYMKDGVSASEVTRVSSSGHTGRAALLPQSTRTDGLTLDTVFLQMSGIRDLIPGSVIDATMFNPCGYSMNGMKTDVSCASFLLRVSCAQTNL